MLNKIANLPYMFVFHEACSKGAIYEKHVVNEPFVQQLQDRPLASYRITIDFYKKCFSLLHPAQENPENPKLYEMALKLNGGF